MMEFLKNLDINLKRKIGWGTLAAACAAQLYFLRDIFSTWFRYELIGNIDVGTVVGAVGLLAIWLFYFKKEM